MNSVLKFVQSLQKMKKSQQQWASLSTSDKSQILNQCADKLSIRTSIWADEWARVEQLPLDFVQSEVFEASERLIRKVCQITDPQGEIPRPTGLISIHLPELFSFRILTERLMPALLAGNGVYVYSPSGYTLGAELWKQLIPEELPVWFFEGDSELEQMMAAHPSIHGVSLLGSSVRAENLQKVLASGFKKAQISSGYHNSALVLSDADLATAVQGLVRSCFTGMGQLPWNISTIYVLESQLADFQKEFFGTLESALFPDVLPQTLARLEQLGQQLRAEKGKVLFGGKPGQPLVVEDLSHCSVLQQECLAAPVIILSPVKYAHEMIKWSNTSYFGMMAQIFGTDEKVEKFGRQLDVSRVVANGWIETMGQLPLGMKQSLWGHPSLHPFGSFFSDSRKIDGLKSKS
jgi:aminomuconate-semialdehyde/2-hydroxymuconate-6-semialdehyde dehydrogenase